MTANSFIVFGALLACSFACDGRGISRRNKTPEVLALKGVSYFVNSEVKGSTLFSYIAITPIYVFLIASAKLKRIDLLSFGLVITFAASMIGLFYSTVFVPENGEIGSQFFTALSAIISLFLVPKLFKFSNLNLLPQIICWLCVAVTCFLGILLIEDIRRKNYGHI